MSVITASEEALGKLEVSSCNLNCLAINQSISELFASRLQYAMESRPGNPHLPRTLFLLQSLQIPKTDTLKFLKQESNAL
jgi:hypothetical protein